MFKPFPQSHISKFYRLHTSSFFKVHDSAPFDLVASCYGNRRKAPASDQPIHLSTLQQNKTEGSFRPAWRLEHDYRVCHNSHKKGERGYTGDGHLDQFYLVPFWSFLHNFHLLDRGFSMSFLNIVQLPYHFVKFTNRKLSRISAP